MRITLNCCQSLLIASELARTVLLVVSTRNLNMTGLHLDDSRSKQEIQEVRETVASTCGDDRRELIGQLRYMFRKLREERQIPPRARDYVAQVAEADRKFHCLDRRAA